jgi:hypothetical protein
VDSQILAGALFSGALCLLTGLIIGHWIANREWVMSAHSHHMSQKAGDQWYWVIPKEWKPRAICPVCEQIMPGFEVKDDG